MNINKLKKIIAREGLILIFLVIGIIWILMCNAEHKRYEKWQEVVSAPSITDASVVDEDFNRFKWEHYNRASFNYQVGQGLIGIYILSYRLPALSSGR